MGEGLAGRVVAGGAEAGIAPAQEAAFAFRFAMAD
jgi:hypothetical protein